jgi:pyrroloquinoline quinone biosynthesis protein B
MWANRVGMLAAILGAAAGGGFPQWNCNAPGCRRARAGDASARARTQASVAVSGDGGASWVLLNASPDLRQQIEANDFLHPRTGLRSSPIAAVVLTGADVDAIAGLLVLRERQPFAIHAAPRVLDVLDANPIFEVLARDIVARQAVQPGSAVEMIRPDGGRCGLAIELFAVAGKVPLFLERPGEAPAVAEDGNTVGACISDGHKRMFFIPACAAMTPRLARRLRAADLVCFDGTLWRDDEMIEAGLGAKSGLRMGHMSLSGPGGTLAAFAGLEVRRKVLIHINNSNPVLLDDSPEHAEVRAWGWEVGYDGMRIAL